MRFENNELTANENETVLDCLLRHKEKVSHSCKSGNCQSCMLKSNDHSISKKAQKGLKVTAIEQGYFLACQQNANAIESVEKIGNSDLFGRALLVEKRILCDDIFLLKLAPVNPLYYHAGQFINLKNSQETIRSYSLASLPASDPYLELHIRLKPGGKMSQWLFKEFEEGDSIDYQGPIGDCFFTPCKQESDIILVGNGTGASPLLGIARDALDSGHKGQLHFYHGSTNLEQLYLDPLLKSMQKQYDNFFYHPCVNSSTPIAGIRQGRCNEVALNEIKISPHTRLYLCGNPEMVLSTRKKAFLSGIASSNIFADPFEYKNLRLKQR